jgi:hypothetical protein
VKNPSGANANASIHDNVGVVEIEAGAVYGNVSAANNTKVELEGNYIRGNLSCGTNANVTNKDGTTANPNAVGGSNTC